MKTQITLAPPYFIACRDNLHILFASLILITACSVFKEKSFFQADSLLKRNASKTIKVENSTQAQAIRIYTSDDSTDNQSYTEIFPRGFFTYSSKDGFHGNAERVLISERKKEGRKVRDAAEILQADRLQSEIKEDERVVTRTRLKEKAGKTNNRSLYYLGGCVLVFVGVYVFRRFWGR